MSSGRASRASQFLPFAALAGYEALVRERMRVPEPRRELTEEDAERLSAELSSLARGDRVRVQRYGRDGYETVRGVVRQVDVVTRTLRLDGGSVPFGDLWRVEREGDAP